MLNYINILDNINMLDILITLFLIIIILLSCYNIKKTMRKETFADKDTKADTKLEIPIISVEQQNRGALITWKGDKQADTYIVILSKTMNPEEGTKLQLTADPHCTECEHALINLDTDTNYTVYIRGFKNEGEGILSSPSNKVHFTPVQKIGYIKPIKPKEIDEIYEKCE